MKYFLMKKNILKATLVAIFSLLGGYNIYNSQKIEKLSDLALTNLEALADDDESSSVTCISDKGDTCVVGNTTVPDYDEGCASWFWG